MPPHQESLRALVVADSDSYLKWAVHRMADLPASWDARLVLVRSAVTPSAQQREAAIDGHLDSVDVMSLRALVELLSREVPDVLLLACRGPFIDTLLRGELGGRRAARAVLAGIPGIWYPPTAKGVDMRSGVDALVVHSAREREAVGRLLPRGRLRLAGLASLARGDNASPPEGRARIVFAPQALVPATIDDRRAILLELAAVAREHPELDVVVKSRGEPGEPQTHEEAVASYEDLALEVDVAPLPPNLIFARGPMRAFLDGCTGFVTVSSTAVLEAIAAGVPSLCLSDAGVSSAQINLVFEDSGLLGSLRDLRALSFRSPDPAWLADNYFHPPAEDDWVEMALQIARTERSEESDRWVRSRGPRAWWTRAVRRAQALGPEEYRWWRVPVKAARTLAGHLR